MRAIFDAIAQHARTRPDAVAFRDPQGTLSWSALAGRLLDTAAALRRHGPGPLGITHSNTLDYVLTDLAASFNGQTIVPLPPFFSPAQIDHVRQAAGLVAVIGPQTPVACTGGDGRGLADAAPEAERIIFTSGSSGTPKGVRIGAGQIMASARGLLAASGAGPGDRHLSILPHAQLLEQIAGILVPILAGAQVTLDPAVTTAFLTSDGDTLVRRIAAHDPSTTVIVPKILSLWLDADMPVPAHLRLVALGGAPVPAALLDRAASAGIPVCQGYGLSECCSVVSFNRPGANRPGTAGQPIAGTRISIENDEIVVHGPTVMRGYLNGAPVGQSWRTGDLGAVDADGYLTVYGRKDNLIVTPEGRNISPEWVEQQVAHLTDAALVAAQEHLVLVVARAPDHGALTRALASLPAYARPTRIVGMPPDAGPLMRLSGSPDRALALRIATDALSQAAA